MKKGKDITALEEFAASQWGMFTTAQAAQLGIQRNQIARLVDKGRAEMLCYGVYRLTVGDETSAEDVKAAWMSVSPKAFIAERMKQRPYDAIVAGRTAAAMHGFGDYYASPYTFIVPSRKQTTRPDMKYLLWELDEQDIGFVGGLPTTSVERTVADLVRLREDPGHIDSFIMDAARQGYEFDVDRLSYLLAPLAARNGYASGDGKLFAKQLLAKSAAPIQMERAQKMFATALEILGDEKEALSVG